VLSLHVRDVIGDCEYFWLPAFVCLFISPRINVSAPVSFIKWKIFPTVMVLNTYWRVEMLKCCRWASDRVCAAVSWERLHRRICVLWVITHWKVMTLENCSFIPFCVPETKSSPTYAFDPAQYTQINENAAKLSFSEFFFAAHILMWGAISKRHQRTETKNFRRWHIYLIKT
jgi:hypothetical protein